jgi:hypothetical protein
MESSVEDHTVTVVACAVEVVVGTMPKIAMKEVIQVYYCVMVEAIVEASMDNMA